MRARLSTAEVHDSPGDYSSGNGGQITLQIRPLDADGSPSGTILGQTAVNNGFGTLCTNAVSNGFDQYALWQLLAPVPVVKGQRYCFFFKNTGSATDWISMDYTICYANVPSGSIRRSIAASSMATDVCRARYAYGSGPDLPRQYGRHVGGEDRRRHGLGQSLLFREEPGPQDGGRRRHGAAEVHGRRLYAGGGRAVVPLLVDGRLDDGSHRQARGRRRLAGRADHGAAGVHHPDQRLCRQPAGAVDEGGLRRSPHADARQDLLSALQRRRRRLRVLPAIRL